MNVSINVTSPYTGPGQKCVRGHVREQLRTCCDRTFEDMVNELNHPQMLPLIISQCPHLFVSSSTQCYDNKDIVENQPLQPLNISSQQIP